MSASLDILKTYKEKITETKIVKDKEIEISHDVVVKVLKGCEFKPRPVRKVVKPSRTVSALKVRKIVNWCNASLTNKPRRTLLSEITKIPLNRMRSIITPGQTSLMTCVEYEEITRAIPKVERIEKNVMTQKGGK